MSGGSPAVPFCCVVQHNAVHKETSWPATKKMMGEASSSLRQGKHLVSLSTFSRITAAAARRFAAVGSLCAFLVSVYGYLGLVCSVEGTDEPQLFASSGGEGMAQSSGEVHADDSMCAWMFDTLIAHFEAPGTQPLPPRSIRLMAERGMEVPFFVTWMKRRRGRESFSEQDVDLRGCIGSLNPRPILSLGQYALISAFDDSRFKPVKHTEISDLKCHVSLLHSFEVASSIYDWEVGRHGITVSFSAPTPRGTQQFSATFLPEVAADMGSKDDTIAALIRKSGYTYGRIDDALKNSIKLTRYQSSQARLSYDEYVSRFRRLENRKAEDGAAF